jgi:hypothetical protein
MDPLVCNACNASLQNTFFFCPNCGKKIKDPPVSTTIGKQIGIYLLSVFLPPLGFWPGVKYMLAPDKKAQMIGLVANVLTLVSTIATVWYSYQLYIQFQQLMASQLGAPSALGF